MARGGSSHTVRTFIKPTIILARANTYKDPKRRKQVIRECEMIQGIFRQTTETPYEVITAQPETGTYLFDQLRKMRFKDQPTLLHIAGFSAGEYLHLEGGWGEESLTPKQFVRLLSRLPSLQMVFLSGCATPALLKELLLMDIPAIMATSESRSRNYTIEIAHTVYEALARGKSLQEAFEATQKNHAHLFVLKRVFYQLEKDQLLWDGREKAIKRNEIEWGLYVLDENQDRLSDELSKLKTSPATPVQDQVKRKKHSKRIVSAMMALGLMTTMLFLLGQHPQIQQLWQSYQNSCSFESQEDFKVLQFPLWETDNCAHSDPFYNESIARRIQQLHHGVEHHLSSHISCSPNVPFIERTLRSCGADVALWGEYRFVNAQTASIHFRYIYLGLPGYLHHGEQRMEMPIHLFNPENDFIYSAVEDIIFWTQGMGRVERGEYQLAIEAFQNMRKTEKPDYYVVDMQLARCFLYLKDFDQAKQHLDHLLKLQPEHTESRFERGNIQLRLGNYAEARRDLDRVIESQPDYADAYYSRGLLNVKTQRLEEALQDGRQLLQLRPKEARTHGLLTVIYAESQNHSQAIEHLEIGLRQGLEAEKLFSAIPSLQDFESDPEVRKLLKEYEEKGVD